MRCLDLLEFDNDVIDANSVLQGGHIIIRQGHTNKDITPGQSAMLLNDGEIAEVCTNRRSV